EGCALIVGFGRFGQIVTQAMLARDMKVSILDIDTDAIRAAANRRNKGLSNQRPAASSARTQPMAMAACSQGSPCSVVPAG
ncbi:hypothetical protein, partial [Achromobacter xylosoxidans]|uniref:hypothetical protein n=1 Tax=Alcaligenes xylosoxydans xylosoxydans TaxID=85698 RepID=UPI001F0FD729